MSAGERVANPFTGLTEDQHCRGQYAVLANGKHCDPTNPKAVQFCALGAMWKANQGATDFDRFMRNEMGGPIDKKNDVDGWTFAQFAEAWDRWQASERAS